MVYILTTNLPLTTIKIKKTKLKKIKNKSGHFNAH
jgi:hypothetical protein